MSFHNIPINILTQLSIWEDYYKAIYSTTRNLFIIDKLLTKLTSQLTRTPIHNPESTVNESTVFPNPPIMLEPIREITLVQTELNSPLKELDGVLGKHLSPW